MILDGIRVKFQSLHRGDLGEWFGEISKKLNYKSGENYMPNGIKNTIENLRNCFFKYECRNRIDERIEESHNAIVNCFADLYCQLEREGRVNQNNWRDVFRGLLIGEDFDELRNIYIKFGDREIRLIDEDIKMLLTELDSSFNSMHWFD